MLRNRYSSFVIFIGLFIVPFSSSCQKNISPSFYVFPSRYSESAVRYFESHKDQFVFAELLTPSNIEAKGKPGVADVTLLTNYINRVFPDKESVGVCLIDWEDPFKDIKLYYRDENRYRKIEDEYIKVIKTIKDLRPNVKVGIYGIPFVSFSPRSEVLEVNKNRRFDRLLSFCDLITPAIYLRYSDDEVGRQRNIAYLVNNLNPAVEYGERLNKPVVPFIWHRIHPMNNRYGLQILSKENMEAYLSELFKKKFKNGRKVESVIWYESNLPSSVRSRQNELKKELHLRDSIIINYTQPFLKRQSAK